VRRITNFLVRFDGYLAITMRMLTIACFVALLVLLSAIVFVRFVPIASLGWTDEIVEWAFAWMVFVGAAVLWRDNEHFRVAWLLNRLQGAASGKVLALAVETLSMIFLATMTYYGMKLTVAAHDRSPILELPRHIWYLCIPLAGMIMIAYSIRNLIGQVLGVRHTVFSGKAQKKNTRSRANGQSP
jgi:TRAP-type C4-dicarboxylate transport system permease small subunit